MKNPRSQERQYFSDFVTQIRRKRTDEDPRKKDVAPTNFKRGDITFLLARHFGFCFGVDNAVEVAYRALNDKGNKRVFLVSEMIHNPAVNRDLENRGVKFLRSSSGEELIPVSELNRDDIVIVPAFGAPLSVMAELEAAGISPSSYDATCPFVEKVWRRAGQLGAEGFTIVVHGKGYHEETRATFSRVEKCSPAGIVLKTLTEVDLLCSFIKEERNISEFLTFFGSNPESPLGSRTTLGFDPSKHLKRIGVVNQTTMLAEETKEVGRRIRQALVDRYGSEEIDEHFADTRDTLCYATSENQSAARALLDEEADFAIVVGGFNSSNTANLAKLLSARHKVYHIRDADDIINEGTIVHLPIAANTTHAKPEKTDSWLPSRRPLTVALTAGASTPDAAIDMVINKIAGLVNG